MAIGTSRIKIGSSASESISSYWTTQFKGRVTVEPSAYRKSVIGKTFKMIQDTGAKLDMLQIYQAPDSETSLLDWINKSRTALGVNTPAFFPYYGIKGISGVNTYINTNFNPSTASFYKQNDAVIGVKVEHTGVTGTTDLFGAADGTHNIAYINNYNAGTQQLIQLNCGNFTAPDIIAPDPIKGVTSLIRSTSTKELFLQNKDVNVEKTKNSSGIPNLNLFVLAINSSGNPVQYNFSTISAIYAGSSITPTQHNGIIDALNYYYDNIFEPVKFTGNLCVIGDSLIAEYRPATVSYSAISFFLRATGSITSLATVGDTIAQQKTKYDALAVGVKSAFSYVFIQVALNDLNPAESAATALGRYQGLIDDIATNSPTAKIVCGTITPCKQRLIDVYGAVDGLVAYQKWIDINEAIKGNGVNAITGVDQVVSSHTDTANDGNGNLATAYDIGDHIHGNNDLRAIIASSWNTAI